MSKDWAQNLFWVRQLNEEQMQAIPYPRLELHIHVLYKTVEAGVVLGTLIGPVIALIRKRPISMFSGPVFNSARNGAIIGAIAGPLMTEMVIKGQPQERIYDRSYRLRYNRSQVRVDRAVTYGSAIGAATTAYMGHGVLPGLLIGIATTCIAQGLLNNTVMKDPEKPKKPKAKIEEVPEVQSKTE